MSFHEIPLDIIRAIFLLIERNEDAKSFRLICRVIRKAVVIEDRLIKNVHVKSPLLLKITTRQFVADFNKKIYFKPTAEIKRIMIKKYGRSKYKAKLFVRLTNELFVNFLNKICEKAKVTCVIKNPPNVPGKAKKDVLYPSSITEHLNISISIDTSDSEWGHSPEKSDKYSGAWFGYWDKKWKEADYLKLGRTDTINLKKGKIENFQFVIRGVKGDISKSYCQLHIESDERQSRELKQILRTKFG